MFEAKYKGNKQKNGRSGAVSKKFASAAFLAAAALTAVFISVAYILNERGITIYVCPFYAATGFKCAACGATRAVFAALSGDLRGGFRLQYTMAARMPYRGGGSGLLFYSYILREKL